MYDEGYMEMQVHTNTLISTDYTTFIHGLDSLMLKHAEYRINVFGQLIESVNILNLQYKIEVNKFEKAIIIDRQCGSEDANLSNVNTALKAMLNKLQESREYIGNYLATVDYWCNGRYKWEECKKASDRIDRIVTNNQKLA